MIFRPKLWTGLGAAVLIGSAGLAACGGEGGGEAGEAGATTASAAVPAGEGGAEGGGEGGEGGAEGGSAEAGASAAYASVPADSRTALRLAQLQGFFLAGQAVTTAQGADDAAALAGQGMLEVFDPAAAELRAAGVDEAVLRKAVQSGASADLAAAARSLEAVQGRAGGDQREVAKGLANLTAGLYREAVGGAAIDPVEYQHAYAGALSLASLSQGGKLGSAGAEAARLKALFTSPVAPATVAQAPKAADVQAQASRIELALSGA